MCDIKAGNGEAWGWSFSCGGGPTAGMVHGEPYVRGVGGHMCADFGFEGMGHGGSESEEVTNSTNSTDGLDSFSSAFSLVLAVAVAAH
jgi:hypothetical protein